MRNLSKTLVYILAACPLLLTNCKKNSSTTNSTPSDWKLSPGNIYEKPITTQQGQRVINNLGINSIYGCGGNPSGSSATPGYFKYPDITIDLSSTSNYATISVTVNSYDIPNRFTIKDSKGNIVASTSWMGFVNYSGPWGMSLNTPETKTLTFPKKIMNTFTLTVETSVNSISDSWNASISCSPSDTIAVVKNANNPYDSVGAQHNKGVSYILNMVSPTSPTLANDILHYTKLYGSTINVDTSSFDSWYSYATANGFFYLLDSVYANIPDSIDNRLYRAGKMSATALAYAKSINKAVDSLISDGTTPTASLYTQVANRIISIETAIQNDGSLSANEKGGLLRAAAVNRYSGAYWANFINIVGSAGLRVDLFKNFSWRRFWHADGTGAVAGAAGGALGGWAGAAWGALLGALGGSAAYAIFND